MGQRGRTSFWAAAPPERGATAGELERARKLLESVDEHIESLPPGRIMFVQDASWLSYWIEMGDKREEAKLALQALKATITSQTLAKTTTKRDELKAAVAEVERRYTLYRNIPYEADAHEVGDAAEQAFKGWP